MDGDFRTEFTRQPAGARHHPALVLNADYRPLSYYPLSLWPWQDAIKAAYMDRVDIVAEYDEVVRSPSTVLRMTQRGGAEGLCETSKARGLHAL